MARLRPTLEFRRGDELVTHVVAAPEATWFAGHFPGQPLLPGVAMLALVEDSLRVFWAEGEAAGMEVTAYRRVRFRQRVEPGASLRVRLRRVEAGRFRFSVELGGAAAATGECATRALEAVAPASEPVAGMWAGLRARDGARFTSDGATVADVLALAERLGALSSIAGRAATVCVASPDRVEVAAAMVAAFTESIDAVLPPGLSVEGVLATARLRSFSHWLGPADWVPALAALKAGRVAAGTAGGPALGALAAGRTGVFLQTGGTTGEPQLWGKTARNLLAEVAAHVHGLRIESADHVLATVPPHHIYGLLFSVLLPLFAGATVERLSPFYPQEIAARVVASGATILVSTPTHLRALAGVSWQAHRLRLVLSSGAPLSAGDARAFFERTRIWPLEIYGSTETGGIAVRRQDGEDSPWLPLSAVECHCQDEALAVRSPYVSVAPGGASGGFFATADLAELRADGRFLLLGRRDGVVKVGGQRVSLPGIEAALLALPGVTDAVVLARPSPAGRGEEIVALVASERAASELGRALRERLPSPSWPRRIRCVREIPTTPSGKRDREAILALLDGEGEAAPA